MAGARKGKGEGKIGRGWKGEGRGKNWQELERGRERGKLAGARKGKGEGKIGRRWKGEGRGKNWHS